MTRITSLDMAPVDMIVALADGNPGALTAMMAAIKVDAEVDPDSALRPLSPLFALDTHGIYGPYIWVLYNDVCGRDAVKMIACLRAVQLGIIGEDELLGRLARPIRQSPAFADQLLSEVKKRLPNFAKESA